VFSANDRELKALEEFIVDMKLFGKRYDWIDKEATIFSWKNKVELLKIQMLMLLLFMYKVYK